MDRFYKGRPGWITGTTEFWQLCSAGIPAGARILEIGAGPDNPTSPYLSMIGELHGVDIDPCVRSNPNLRTARVITEGTFPVEAESFDACVSDFVLEHVEDPVQHLRQVWRALRPGGSYLFRTPNKWH